MKRLLLFVLIALSLLVTSACQPVSPWAAQVNGDTISASVVNDEIHAVLSNPKYAEMQNESLGGSTTMNVLQQGGSNTVNAQYTSQVISGRVVNALVEQELEQQHITITQAARDRAVALFHQQVTDPSIFDNLAVDYRSYLTDRVAGLLLLLDAKNTPAKQLDYYNLHQSDFASVCVRHILVSTEAQAAAIRAQLVAGADFATIAKTQSLDNDPTAGSAQKGGDLGCLTNDQLSSVVQPFAAAVKSLNVGDISQPVQTQFGFHIIEVTSRQQLTFEQAQSQISQTLSDPNAFVDSLLAGAKIKINPRYGVYTPADPKTGQGAAIASHPAVTLGNNGSSSNNSLITQVPSTDGGTSQSSTPQQ